MQSETSFSVKNIILILMICSTQVEKLFHICLILELLYIIISGYDYVLNGLKNKRIEFRSVKHISIIWLLLAFYVTFITIVYPSQYIGTADTFFKWVRNIIIFFLVIKDTLNNPRLFQYIVVSYVLTSLTCSELIINGIGLSVDMSSPDDLGNSRLSFLGINANKLAITYVYSMAILFYLFDECKKYSKFTRILIYLFVFASAFSFIYILSLLASRGSILLLFIFVGYYFLLYGKNVSLLKRMALIFIGIIISLYIYDYLFSSDILSRRVESSVEDGNYGARDLLLFNAIDIFMDSPIFGVGLNEVCYRNYLYMGVPITPHNYIAYMLSAGGLLGIIIFVRILYFLLKNILWLSYKRQYLISALFFIAAFIDINKNGACVIYIGNYIFLALAYSYTCSKLNMSLKGHSPNPHSAL